MRREYIFVVIHERKFLFSAYVSFILPLDVILLKVSKERERRNGKKNHEGEERAAFKNDHRINVPE